MGGFGGEKGNGEMLQLYYSPQNNKKGILQGAIFSFSMPMSMNSESFLVEGIWCQITKHQNGFSKTSKLQLVVGQLAQVTPFCC